MSSNGDTGFASELTAITTEYADRIAQSVAFLHEAYEGYGSNGPYHGAIEQVRAAESECDRYHRRVRYLLAGAAPEDFGLLGSRFYVNRTHLLGLYDSLDEVANRAEEAASNLTTMHSPHSEELFERLTRLAAASVRAAGELQDALTTLTRCLRATDASETIDGHIRTVREIESEADTLRNEVVSAAFNDPEIDDPLVVRAIARSLDDVINAIEDTTDRIAVVASVEPGIAVVDPGDPPAGDGEAQRPS